MVPMRILMISAEYAPFAKAGGLADMVTGLSKALARAGHDVRVVLPLYSDLRAHADDQPGSAGLSIGDTQVSPVALRGTHPGYMLRQYTERDPSGPLVYRVDAPAFFGSGTIYGGGELEARRFALLAHAGLRLCELLDWPPLIVHCHDWHAALATVLLKHGYQSARLFRGASSVLTIHNIGYQGVFAGSLGPELGLGGAVAAGPGTRDLNFLRDGLLAADALTTVSPTHAAEILTPEYGMGLDALLRQRRNRLVGILNGVDYSDWDPATDPRIPARYSADNLAGKRACRDALLHRAGLQTGLPVPLVGMVSRLAEQKGVELVAAALPQLLEQRQLQAVIVGQGEERYAAELRKLAAAHPTLFHYFDAQDESLARQVFAGSDAFLVPSMYEPCGLTQLYSLRYGAVPVVRETGGLKDTVRHFDAATGTGTGSVFKDADGQGLAWAIGEVLAWHRQPGVWARLQQNGMAEDFSWRHQAPRYEALYRQLTGTGINP
ncbi:MAG: glycogen synthase [Gammaproteobacteria bacterium]